MSLPVRLAEHVGADNQEHTEHDKCHEGVGHVLGGSLVVLFWIIHC